MDKTQKHKILIVDDDSSNIIVLTHILSSEYTIQAAKNGRSAIQAVEKHLPDVILLDIIMPEMDGYAVITELKKSEKMRNIPVIFITDLSHAEDEEKGLALGAADYISRPFSSGIVKLRLNNQIKMLNQMRTIERLSMIDQLTELPNRRSFDNRLDMEWNRALREHTPISVLMMDVDNFKRYNDTHGHLQGDIALQSMARALKLAIKRSGDFAARWGGEEFIVLLPNTDSSGALEIAEQIRKYIEDMEIACSDRSAAKITTSIGASTRTFGQNSAIDKFMANADAALYAAKSKGRNRVCHCDIV